MSICVRWHKWMASPWRAQCLFVWTQHVCWTACGLSSGPKLATFTVSQYFKGCLYHHTDVKLKTCDDSDAMWKWLDWYRAYDVSTLLLDKFLFYPLGIWCECKGCVCPKQGCRTAGAFPRPIDSIGWLWRRSVEIMWKKTSSSKSNHSSQSRDFLQCYCSSFLHSSPSVDRLSGLQLVCTASTTAPPPQA